MKNLIDFVAAVQDNARGEAQPGEPMRYLLVDHAGAPGLMQALQRRPSLTWTSLFKDSKEVGALEVAPILIRLPDARANFVEREFLEWLYRACQYSTSVTVLHSAWERDRLANALRTRLDMMLPDRMPVMLRYFDTRALESLLRVLTAEQQGNFLGVASRWQWLDRAGQLHQRSTKQLTIDPWPHRLEIDVIQQNTLIESGEADALVAQMNAQAPDLCRHEQRAELHALAERCASKFGPLGIDDIRTRALYCLTAWELGWDFDSQPGWAEALGRVAKRQISFEAALGEMGA